MRYISISTISVYHQYFGCVLWRQQNSYRAEAWLPCLFWGSTVRTASASDVAHDANVGLGFETREGRARMPYL
eukprot:7886644-Pyramimonas_sp.AAC.1